jgi:parvulin-like peptidyl-prolyl isomerase
MKSYLIIIVFVVAIFNLFAQNDESVVAQVGNDKIIAREFKLQLELAPYIPKDQNIPKDSIKYDFLYSLIAEKLLANEAELIGIAKTEKFQFFFKPLEDLFVRDALFKKEIDDKVKLTADDINSGIMKSQVKLKTQMISSKDSLQIYNFFNHLKSNKNIDSLLSINPEISSKNIDISLGVLFDEEIEDSLYSLNVNQYTAPIKSEVGWVIFIVKNKIFTPIDLQDKKSTDNIKSIIKNRRINRQYKEYLNNLLSGLTIKINPEAFNATFSLLWNKLKNKWSGNDTINYFEISESDFQNILASTPQETLSKTLFDLGDKKIPLLSFLSQLAFDGFNVTLIDSITVLQKLNQKVKKFVEDQLITQEGYVQQLNLTPQVLTDLARWREKYLAQFYSNAVLDSIKLSQNDVYNYYLDNLVNASNIRLLNIRLITLKDLEEVSKILESLKQGTDFGEIVKQYGKTDSLVNNNGETGLTPVLLLGYVGQIASELNLNQVYGPIQRNDAYTIMQVIERQDSNDSLKLSFDSIKNQLRNDLRFKKLNERLNKITSNLAEQNNVKIFDNVVDKIQTTRIPMFVYRLMGFGGRIAGMPLVTPFSNWIKSDKQNKSLP